MTFSFRSLSHASSLYKSTTSTVRTNTHLSDVDDAEIDTQTIRYFIDHQHHYVCEAQTRDQQKVKKTETYIIMSN